MDKTILNLFALIALLAAPNAIACTCPPFPTVYITPEETKEYSHIVTGTCLAIEPGNENCKYTFKRNEVYRGFLSIDTFEVYAPTMCGVWPKVGEKWLISANLNSGRLLTSECSRTYKATTFPGKGCIEVLDSMYRSGFPKD